MGGRIRDWEREREETQTMRGRDRGALSPYRAKAENQERKRKRACGCIGWGKFCKDWFLAMWDGFVATQWVSTLQSLEKGYAKWERRMRVVL